MSCIIENPTLEITRELSKDIKKFDATRHIEIINRLGNPIAIEYSTLQKGFGYEIFNEGVDVNLIYPLQVKKLGQCTFLKNCKEGRKEVRNELKKMNQLCQSMAKPRGPPPKLTKKPSKPAPTLKEKPTPKTGSREKLVKHSSCANLPTPK